MEPVVDPSAVETIALPLSSPSSSSSTSHSRVSVDSAPDEGRFLPGTLLVGRYRIIGLLGRGGMGEVYRATDLTLGQSVALKFLPGEAASNQRLLERFHGEVRVARQVSHPNVCRVYDIGQADGMPFISMEYIDGEDLASLLRRIGRLPADKAIETARKICAGLSAAHDRGVIHRDLKPQNIMMNRRGEVVIMDFGLAAIADQLSGAEVRNGTPAYMAPEQLRGSEVTARSDIFALGLVLYELFTGKKPYEARSTAELIGMQESAQLSSMTSIAADIEPGVEKAIRRCLDPDASKRPATALQVAAALPGGDPLAAALAAGETPSPDMVAAAGAIDGLARRYSIPCLAIVLVCLFGSMAVRDRKSAVLRATLDLTPQVLAQKSREVAVSLGYPKRPDDSIIWLDHRGPVVNYLNERPGPKKYELWLNAEAPIASTYRESPSKLIALPAGAVTATDPAPIDPGMVQVRLDGHGHLREFFAVPYRDEGLKEPIPYDAVFRAAGLDFAAFTETTPTALPRHAADLQLAWKGPHPVLEKTEVTVQIATWKGRVTQVSFGFPWVTPPGSAPPAKSSLAEIRDLVQLVVFTGGALFAVLLARRNWNLGRVDRKGAVRLACAKFLLGMLSWIGLRHAVPNDDMIWLFCGAAAEWLFAAAMIWLLYLALEPALRARWPHSIVTWNRLLAGRWLDARVGADVLIGATVACSLWVTASVVGLLVDDKINSGGNLRVLLGVLPWTGTHAETLGRALNIGLIGFFAIFLLRTLLRKELLAAIAAAAFFILSEGNAFNSPKWYINVAIYALIYAVLIFVLLRVGLVGIVSTVFFINSFAAMALGSDWSTWHAPAGLATLLLLSGVAIFAFWRSLGARELLSAQEASG